VPNLISVYLRYDPAAVAFADLAGEVRLRLSPGTTPPATNTEPVEIAIRYGGADGPDLGEVASASGLDVATFIERHSAQLLRVLAIGFAPGFAYCGFHLDLPLQPRRGAVRPRVPEGTILYAAGQTALTATPIPTGWHVIGRSDFRNFDAAATPPLRLKAGDLVRLVPQ
jgi:KipI family sensor histidine kinase inhibitor